MATKKKETSSEPVRKSAGIYTVNGQEIRGAKDGKAAQAKYDKKYGAKKKEKTVTTPVAETPAAPPPPTTFESKNPFGGKKLKVDENGNLVEEEYLTPGEQDLFDKNQKGASGAYDRIESFQQNPFEYQKEFNSAFDQVYNLGRQKLDDRFAREDQMNRQRLANEGITEGSEQYNQRMKDFQTARSDADSQLRSDSLNFAGSQYDRAFGTRKNYEDIARSMLQGPRTGTSDTSNYYNQWSAGQRQDDQQASDESLLGIRNQFESRENSKQRDLTRWQTNKSLAGRGGGGGGGGGGGTSFEDRLAQTQAMNDLNFQDWTRKQTWAAQNTPKQKQPNPWLQLGATALGAAATGAGQSFGSSWSK